MTPPPDLPNLTAAQLEQLTLAVGCVHRAATVDEGLRQLAQAARRIVPAHQSATSLCLDASAPFRSTVSYSDKYAGWPSEQAEPDAICTSLCRGGEALRLSQPELELHALWPSLLETAAQRPPPRGCLAVPLLAGDGTPLGALTLSDRVEGDFSALDAALLAQLAHLSSHAIESIRLRERLSEQEQRLRIALDAASLGTWEHVTSTHATSWDARSKAMFGYGPDDTLDFERYRAALHPDDVDLVFQGIAKAIDPSGPGECSMQYRIRSADGTERWVEAHGRCVFAEGVALRVNGTLLDITARKQAEETLRETARRKDEFLAILGHELRNPLAPIRSALDVMRRLSPEHAVREREVIERQVRHMIRLVDDLLDLARIARGTVALKLEQLELAPVVARAIEMTSPLFEARGHQLVVDVPAQLEVTADPVRLSQVLGNLLTNAARYTPPGGHIAVRAYTDAVGFAIEVDDNGIGIEPHELATIFQPFVQSARHMERGQGGLGLGLSLVQDLMRLHGGHAEAHSAGPGRGSRFVVRLPVPASPAEALAAPEPQPKGASGRRVLVVDDNQDAAEMLGLLLEAFGYSVRIAHDGAQALAAATAFQPELAVVDLGLPVMDGLELARRLGAEHGPRLRLLALTGYGQPEDRERSKKAGFHVHLVKPVDPEALKTALEG